MTEKELEPCSECGQLTSTDELDRNERELGERVCDNCAELWTSYEDEDLEEE